MVSRLSLVFASALAAACSAKLGATDAGDDASQGSDGATGADASFDTGVDTGLPDAHPIDASTDAPKDVAVSDAKGDPFGCTLTATKVEQCQTFRKAENCAKQPPANPNSQECEVLCLDPFGFGCSFAAATSEVTCNTCGLGRRPEGFVPLLDDSSVGEWFRSASVLEAASVDAFEILHDDLLAHGAPSELLALAKSARADEVRHARLMREFARAAGCEVTPLPISHPAGRNLETIAIENAVEGCVRETYGALVGAWQAARVPSQRLARVMASIARDELAHAELSWRVHEWALGKLAPEARLRVERAMVNAVAELRESAKSPVRPDMQHKLGLPSSLVARVLVGELESKLWRHALAA